MSLVDIWKKTPMELSFKEKDTFMVDAILLEDESRWWATHNGVVGVFPVDLVQVLSGAAFPRFLYFSSTRGSSPLS